MKTMLQSFYTTQLNLLYDAETASKVAVLLDNLVGQYRGQIPTPQITSLSETDSILITYGDQVRAIGQPHLKTLAEFCETHLRGMISGMHILPFYPWSSDDGFSVMDFRSVDPDLGDWGDVERLGRSFRLMFDGVINHASVQGQWFQDFLHEEKPYRDYFLTVECDQDLSQVVRPRMTPLLTEFPTKSGKRCVWTTFSADQADLDYHNPDVLLEIFDILLMYVKRGAQFIRLDAIAYLWKQIGSPCIHLPQTHAIIRLLRAVLDDVAPYVRLITETNVPHSDNISYFGDGKNEAQLVYNFALPPLVLHTFRTGDASVFSEWARGLDLPSGETTFFNFLASHDGIGLNPVKGILNPDAIQALIAQTLAHGGLISNQQNVDGMQSPYELNINYFDALSNPFGEEPLAMQIERFMAAYAIMLSLRGVPGIYFHSFFGSRNWPEGVKGTLNNRSINREKLIRVKLEDELANHNSLRSLVFARFQRLLGQRADSEAFHPQGGQKILDLGREVFAVLRSSPSGSEQMLCLQNVTEQKQFAGKYALEPYQTLWLENPQ
jgi:glucosylglycerate phosphorylase